MLEFETFSGSALINVMNITQVYIHKDGNTRINMVDGSYVVPKDHFDAVIEKILEVYNSEA